MSAKIQLTDARNLAHALTNDTFRVIVPGTTNGKDFMMRVQTADLPSLTLELVPTMVGRHQVQQVVNATPDGSWTFTVREDINGSILRNLLNWRDTVRDFATGQINNNNKRNCTVYREDPSGRDVIKYEFYGCLPTELPLGSVGLEDAAPLDYDVTLSFDGEPLVTVL